MSDNVKHKYDLPDGNGHRSGARSWLAPAAIAALGLIAIVGLVVLSGQKTIAPTKSTPLPVPETKIVQPEGPRFDTVRVDAGGNAIIAGRAAPGDTVTINVNGKPIGDAKAGADGSFAYVTTTPLPPGSAEITLEAKSPDGTVHKGTRSVAVNVPKAPSEGALAVLSGSGNTASKLLTGQGPQPGTLGIASVDYDATGHATIAGTAPAGAQISLFLDNNYVGGALTGKDGRWVMHVTNLPDNKPGTFTLETIRPDGTIIDSIKTAFAPAPVQPAASGQVVIKPGECLWLIARKIYGEGTKYTLIYKANEGSIQDPDLIYPGQKLVIPEPKK